MAENFAKNHHACKKCKDDFVYKLNETWWDYKGSTDTKLVKCPYCGTIQAIKYIVPKNINEDVRYYFK